MPESSQSGSAEVTLSGGPWDGQRVPRPSDRSLLVQDAHEPYVARYRQSRDRNVFRFKGYDRIVASIPMEGS